jgi:hypothetical protein
VDETVRGLIDFLDAHPDAEIVVITNGITNADAGTE